MTITHFQRKPLPLGHFSIESYFSSIRELAPSDLQIKPNIAPYYSKGILQRIFIALDAFMHQGTVNHITGDIHFIAPFLNKSKTILTIHDCGQLRIKSGLSYRILKMLWFTLPCICVKSITVNSEFTKADLLSYVDIAPTKIKVIPIFVSDIFKASPKVFNKLKPIVLQIGTAHNKNIERTIRGLAGIPCHFKVLGKLSSLEKELMHALQIEHSNIENPLTVEELFRIYQSADIISLVSTLEGFGMPIVEANLVGRVVITSEVTSMPEIAGDAAHLVNPMDVAAIQAGYKKIIEDDVYRDRLISNGYKNAERFTRHAIAEQYFKLYRSLA